MKTGLYDLSASPATYEFINFALQAKAAGCEQVIIVPGRRAPRVTHYSDTEVDRRVRTMMIPICRALGMAGLYPIDREAARVFDTEEHFPHDATIDSPRACHGTRDIASHMPLWTYFNVNPVVKAHLPKTFEGAITITIREQDFQPNRNSNIAEWIAAARILQSDGHHVVFVPDYERLDTDFGGFDVCIDAAVSMEARIALYSIAAVNLFITNGPCSLALMTALPCIIMKLVIPEYRNCSEAIWRKAGIGPDHPPHWFGPHQRLVWQDDTCANIVAAVRDWCAANPERVANTAVMA